MNAIANTCACWLRLMLRRAGAIGGHAGVSVAIITTALCVAAAQAVPVSYTAVLRGSSEVPPNGSTNTGRTRVVVDVAANTVAWTTKSSIPVGAVPGAVTVHHLHVAAVGANGPIVVNFNGSYGGTVTLPASAGTLAADIVANPTGFYVNLHTVAFSGGELRGQLLPEVCSMDIDNDGRIDATTDGLLIARAMLGLTGTAVTNGALGVAALRTSWADIRTFLNGQCGTSFAL
jgi:CHRD domain